MNTFWQALDRELIAFPGKRPTPPQVIAAAKLPPEIARVITTIVRRTRLRQCERADLAAELCTHFADGLSAGVAPAQLVKDFGDPARSARLIARAIKRKRSWKYQFLRRSVQAAVLFVLTLVFVYAWLFIRFHYRQPNIARNFSAEYNARFTALPEDQRGWTLYRQALPNWVFGSKELRDAYPPSDPESAVWNEGVENLKANAANLDLIRKAADLPGWGVLLKASVDPALKDFSAKMHPSLEAAAEQLLPKASEANPPMVYTQLPELGISRFFARTLAFDMDVAARAHDTGRFNADVKALLGLCRQMREQHILISDLVSSAVGTMLYLRIYNNLYNFPEAWTDDTDLVQLAHILAAWPANGDSFRCRFDGERDSFDDMLQRIYSDDGQGDGAVVAKGRELYEGISLGLNPTGEGVNATRRVREFLGPAASVITLGRAESRRIYNEYLSRAEAIGSMPLWQRGENTIDSDIERAFNSDVGRVRYHVLGILMPALGSASGQGEYLEQQRDAAIVAVCLEIYKRRHGSYPATLDALVPALLPAIPPDRYTGGPIHYLIRDNRPVLYSVGVDRTDNQGVPPPGPNGNLFAQRYRSPAYANQLIASYGGGNAHEDIRGDWVLYPDPKDPRQK